LQYSVNESNLFVEITIINKNKKTAKIGIRTIDGSAKETEDYEKLDKAITLRKEDEMKIKIAIMDDDDWEPDEDFFVELYDTRTGYKLKGKDTRCTVTIIDDDKPGTLSLAVQ
jgi:hypothetical protein